MTLPQTSTSGAAITRCPYAHNTDVDPCMQYIYLREGPPVRWDPNLSVWIVTGADEARACLKEDALSSAWPRNGTTALHTTGTDGDLARTDRTARQWFMFMDAPEHTRLRKMVAPLFSVSRTESLRPLVERITNRIVEESREEFDVMSELSIPLSSEVICELAGIPPDAAEKLNKWSNDIAAALIADHRPEVPAIGRAAFADIEELVLRTQRNARDQSTILGLLRHKAAIGEIQASEIPPFISLMVFAGFKTTSTFIGKAVRAALHTGSYSRFTDSREVAELVEELLRFDSSVPQVARVARRDVRIGGQLLRQGSLVVIMLGVANRDTRIIPDADRLIPERPVRRHLAFGLGQHYCLGANLARLETQVALHALATRWPSARLTDRPRSRSHHGIRVLDGLDCVLEVGRPDVW